MAWIFFTLIIVIFLTIDLFCHRKARTILLHEACLWSGFWILMAAVFAGYLYYIQGRTVALTFVTAYFVEKALSIDNLFVIALIFHYFCTPQDLLHKVLFWGVLGAIVMRCICIFLGIALIQNFHWILYLFGAFLIFNGIQLMLKKDKKIDPEKNFILKILRRWIPITKNYEGEHFFLTRKGRRYITPLLVVLISIESTDLLFAVDSIPVVLGITQNPLLVYTSNIFAVLGLRALYFVLSHGIRLFVYLHYGLAIILILIGVKMLLADFVTLPVEWALLAIALILGGAIGSSLFVARKR